MKRLAFTMSEALIVLGIVAVLATLSIIALNNAKPDESIIMYRRAYANTLKVIQNLMNDAELYPNATVIAKGDMNSKFDFFTHQYSTIVYEDTQDCFHIDPLSTECYEGNSGNSGNNNTDKSPYCLTYKLIEFDDVNCDFVSNGFTCDPTTCKATGCAPSYEKVTESNGSFSCKKMCAIESCSSNATITNGTCLNGCVKCNTGYAYNSSTGKCQSKCITTKSCNSGESINNGSCVSGCIRCNEGFKYSDKGKCVLEVLCPIGQKVNSTGTACEPDTPDEPDNNTPTTSPYDKSYDFSSLATSVFGKGFSDTEITAKMKTKYPYLSSASASNKFAYSFMYSLNPVTSSVSGSTASFSTADGIYWVVDDHFNDSSNPYATVTVYLDGESKKSNSCYYNSTSCVLPNIFTFYVEKSGKVHNRLGTATNSAKDPMACSYARYSSVTKQSKINTNSSQNSCFSN